MTEKKHTKKKDWQLILSKSSELLTHIIFVCLSSGARIGEILQLKENNIYLDENHREY